MLLFLSFPLSFPKCFYFHTTSNCCKLCCDQQGTLTACHQPPHIHTHKTPHFVSLLVQGVSAQAAKIRVIPQTADSNPLKKSHQIFSKERLATIYETHTIFWALWYIFPTENFTEVKDTTSGHIVTKLWKGGSSRLLNSQGPGTPDEESCTGVVVSQLL